MLVHDHDILSSQVEHVTALVRGLTNPALNSNSLCAELIQQAELLRDQLLEHFGFEEEGAFPFLADLIPSEKANINALSSAHDSIAGAISQVVQLGRLASRETLTADLGPIINAYDRFYTAFSAHVQAEAEFLSRVSSALDDNQRRAVEERMRGVL